MHNITRRSASQKPMTKEKFSASLGNFTYTESVGERPDRRTSCNSYSREHGSCGFPQSSDRHLKCTSIVNSMRCTWCIANEASKARAICQLPQIKHLSKFRFFCTAILLYNMYMSYIRPGCTGIYIRPGCTGICFFNFLSLLLLLLLMSFPEVVRIGT